MECDMCGSDENLVRVKNELGEMIFMCQACYDMQHDGYEKSEEADLNDDELEAWEEEKLDKIEGGLRGDAKSKESDDGFDDEDEDKEA